MAQPSNESSVPDGPPPQDAVPAPPPSDRRVTFRKRRLSLPLHHLSAREAAEIHEAAEASGPDGGGGDSPSHHQHQHHNDSSSSTGSGEKAHTFRKRRLSLTTQSRPLMSEGDEDHHNNNNNNNRIPKRSRRNSEASATSAASNLSGTPLRPKTMHSGELLNPYNDSSAPPSPAVHSDNILYTRQSLPPPMVLPPPQLQQQQQDEPQNHTLAASSTTTTTTTTIVKPKWSKRQTVGTGDEHKLPFPRDIVGTYSCHGSEPVYDSSYEDCDEADEEEEDDDAWMNGNVILGEGKPAVVAQMEVAQKKLEEKQQQQQQQQGENKPTTAAKINQDRGGVAYPYGNNKETALFAVYDGHGQGGEHVSQFALHEIQRRFEKHPSFKQDVAKAFKETFLAVDEALKLEPLIEPFFAGTTACVALLKGSMLTLANAGDSRAVLARKVAPETWQAIDLTEDQNPDLPREMERITASGGYVSPSPAPGLSARVWLDSSCTQIGLAMARSIGDHTVSSVGVIAEPEITYHEMEENDDFMILASDGVWEFLESDDAVKIVGENLDRGATKACQALIEAAAAKWHEEEGEYRDDITAIVVRLQDLWKK